MAVNSINQQTIQDIIDSTSARAKERKTGEMGKDDFLNLLVTQLRYQDPLQPVDDKEFISQMAQFSSLEQMQNMNTSISSQKAFSLIDKHVVASLTDEKTGETKQVDGLVSSVKMSNGKTYVVVKGEDIPIDQVTEVTEGYLSDSNLSAYTSLIGYSAKGVVYDSSTGDMVAVNGKVKAVQRGIYEDYAVMDGVQVRISSIITANPSSDPDFMENYLEANKGKSIDVKIKDSKTGIIVPVTGTLRSYTISGDIVTAVLDDVNVPVESISNITRPAEEVPADTATPEDTTDTRDTTPVDTGDTAPDDTATSDDTAPADAAVPEDATAQ